MDKEQNKQNSTSADEFDMLLQQRKLNTEAKTNIESFISAPKTDKVGVIENGDDSAIGEFIAKPFSEEERIGGISAMHPELLNSLSDTPEQPVIRKHNGIKTALKILISIIIVLGLAIGVFLKLSSVGNECDKEYSNIAQKVLENSDECFSALIDINSDFAGYLTLNDYEYPVVKPQENSEEYYLSHLFSGKANKYGTLYTNSHIEQEGFPSVTAIYGSGTDSRMLGSIREYQSKKSNGIINFDSPQQNGVWAIFSAFSYKDTEPFLLDRLSFLNENLEKEYIDNFYKYSAVDYDIDVAVGDKFLVLIAKDGDKNHVAAFRLLREGESENDLAKRVIDTAATNKPQPSKPEETEESKTESTSSKTQSTSITSSKATESKEETKPIKTDKRYEQTGLTDNMDKTVKVDISPVVRMENVVGMTKSGAVSLLENTLGFPVKVIEKESTEKRGTVIDQSVAANAEISTDNTVTITVSIGLSGGKTLMPDLIGASEATVDIMLDKYELLKGKITTETSALEKGTIISQSVDPDTEIATNTKINLVVSDGKGELQTVKMPNLSGKTKAQASTEIKKVGLKVGKITTVTSSKPAGTVISQEVPSGKKVAQNEAVGFNISNGSKVNNLTVKNLSSWSVTINGKTYAPGDYIKGDYMDIIPYIVEAEMGGGFSMEALKAQAIAAYCWLINAGSTKGSAPAVPLKNPTQKAIDAASAVNGQKVIYGGETAQTYYYAISAGYTANCKDVWYADISYLRAVNSSVDKDYYGFKTTVTYSASELQSRVSNTYGVNLSGISKSKWFSIKYDENDAYVRRVTIGGSKQVTGSSFRDELLDYELRSTAFKVKYNKSSDTFTFTVRGFGHGVGMSQVGANYYAKQGWTYKEILTHYYPGTSVQ